MQANINQIESEELGGDVVDPTGVEIPTLPMQ